MELARKLAPRAESGEALVALLDDLERRKQLSDERFAELRAHVLSRKYGTARIRLDLRAKGIAEQTVERMALASAESDVERARAILARRYAAPAATLEERARRSRFLQGRGFSHAVIGRLLGRDSIEE